MICCAVKQNASPVHLAITTGHEQSTKLLCTIYLSESGSDTYKEKKKDRTNMPMKYFHQFAKISNADINHKNYI